MSLPSWAIFYYKGEEVLHHFVNCGWFLSEDLIRDIILEMQYPDDSWDVVKLYDKTYTKDDIRSIILND